jgi:hypothetical protein
MGAGQGRIRRDKSIDGRAGTVFARSLWRAAVVTSEGSTSAAKIGSSRSFGQ